MSSLPPALTTVQVRRTATNVPDNKAAKTNCLYVSEDDDVMCNGTMVLMRGYVFHVWGHPLVQRGGIAMNAVQRKMMGVNVGEGVEPAVLRADVCFSSIATLYADVGFISAGGGGSSSRHAVLHADQLVESLRHSLHGQVLAVDQQIIFELNDKNYKLTVTGVTSCNGCSSSTSSSMDERSCVTKETLIVFTNGGHSAIEIVGQTQHASTQLFKPSTLNLETLGIGGLDAQFEAIFRRAFASRVLPPALVKKLGIKHVKGILLYGPPGTGKTLIARQIGKMLNGLEPKVVNGPEVLNKYVGQSEENIRNLFLEADAEYKAKGDESGLHIIIFDEIDAICKQRQGGGGGGGASADVRDTVVNQLLSKIDGVEAVNNILLIGMTNRRDLLDEAMLRPGRFEVQIEVGLPDEVGRHQILRIHTSTMKQNSFLANDVDLTSLVARTENFSGAELEGLVKSATAYAIHRQVDFDDLRKPLDEHSILVTMDDFTHALQDIQPAFGAVREQLELYLGHGGLVSCGESFDAILRTVCALQGQIQRSDRMPLLTCVLEGPPGSGKSAIAAAAAIDSKFPFVKVVAPGNMVGCCEQTKVRMITRTFEDAYRSPLSIIILDDIERIVEYAPIGPRFSNSLLQTILVLLKRRPPNPQCRLFVIGTTSADDFLQTMGVLQAFDVSLHVPALSVCDAMCAIRAAKVKRAADATPYALDTLDTLDTLHAQIQDKLAERFGNSVPIKKMLQWLELLEMPDQ